MANLGQWAISEEREKERGMQAEKEGLEGTRSRLFHRKSSRVVSFTEEQ